MTPFLFPVAKDFAWLFIDRYVSTETTGSQPPWGALVAAYEDSFVLSAYFIQGTRHQDFTHFVSLSADHAISGFPTSALVRAVSDRICLLCRFFQHFKKRRRLADEKSVRGRAGSTHGIGAASKSKRPRTYG